MIALLHQMFEN